MEGSSRNCLSCTGELVRSFGSHGKGLEFINPRGVAVSADNHIFVADDYFMTCIKFTSLMSFGLCTSTRMERYAPGWKGIFH